MSHPQRSILAAVTLFFIAPLVAEFLLGDFPATWLPLIIVLAPMYGGGALLIRELARRTGRGWPTILLLGVAYAIIEEAFTTQTLFNPDIFGMHMHLLSHAWIPALGIGAWWTLFMLNVHAFWSIGVSIALVEGLFPSRARTPWLGNVGLSVAAVLFAIGVVYNTAYTFHHDPFRATHTQFIVSASVVVVFVIAAFLIPPASRNQSDSTREPRPAPPAFDHWRRCIPSRRGHHALARSMEMELGRPRPSCSLSIWFFSLGWACSRMQRVDASAHLQRRRWRRASVRCACVHAGSGCSLPQVDRPRQPCALYGPCDRSRRHRRPAHSICDAPGHAGGNTRPGLVAACPTWVVILSGVRSGGRSRRTCGCVSRSPSSEKWGAPS